MLSSMATMSLPLLNMSLPNGYPCTTHSTRSFKRHSSDSSFTTPVTGKLCDQAPIVKRRSGNYQPPLWKLDYIQSLNNNYSGDKHSDRVSELKEQIMKMLTGASGAVDQLEFIDDLQRLGISYHFKDEIKHKLTCIYEQMYLKDHVFHMEKDLYTEALAFRLMRQHGFKVSQETFDCFMDEKGEFMSSLGNDIKGVLQLYEASHLLREGESTLELAREFSTNELERYLDDSSHASDDDTTVLVRSALELPIHWRVERLNTKFFIYAYERRPDMNLVVLEFAKLDFNILQSIYQDELKQVSAWWNGTSLSEKLPFARDRYIEAYFWSIGLLFEPQHRYYRIMMSKLINFIALFDDIYDVYGTLEEVQIFTDAIERWDIEAIDQLPEYMQIFYLALNNYINEISYDVIKDQGSVIIPYLRKMWRDYSKVNLQEATWYHQRYTPTMEEYLRGAWISVSGPVVLTHGFFLLANPIEKEVVQSLYKYHDIVQSSSMIFRLMDDWGTSPEEMKRGDVSKSIQCYMNENSATEKEARDYIRLMLRETWKKVNEERVAENQFPQSFIESAVGLCRMSHHVYRNGDGFGAQNALVKNEISSLIFDPIP